MKTKMKDIGWARMGFGLLFVAFAPMALAACDTNARAHFATTAIPELMISEARS